MNPPPAIRPAAPPWRARAESVRDAPLEPLAARLGYRQDPASQARWKLPGSVLSITGSRFFDHCRGCGGGGAIDLVMHARGCRFREAVEFLEHCHPALPLAAASPGSPTAPDQRNTVLQLPPREDRHWPLVRDFLAASRGLHPALLDLCRQDGILYADHRRNAVFLCRDPRRQPTGAEIVGTRPAPDGRTFKGMAPGSRKARGGFWLPAAADLDAVLICESAVDALSALLLLAPALPPDTLLASTAGVAATLPRWLQAFRAPHTICAYDADHAGDLAADAIRLRTPSFSRLRPVGAKDCNADIRTMPLSC